MVTIHVNVHCRPGIHFLFFAVMEKIDNVKYNNTIFLLADFEN